MATNEESHPRQPHLRQEADGTRVAVDDNWTKTILQHGEFCGKAISILADMLALEAKRHEYSGLVTAALAYRELAEVTAKYVAGLMSEVAR